MKKYVFIVLLLFISKFCLAQSIDTDRDGIADSIDKCVDMPGVEKYNGCPAPDADNDGIPDEQDKCPNEIGYARYDGCPVPDSDSDGINDEQDLCPTEKGTVDNYGCPPSKQYSLDGKNVQFAVGSAVLSSNAKKELDISARVLNARPDVKMVIEGHASDTGNEESDKRLSQERADAVKAYLGSKGVSTDRLTATGLGSINSIAGNGAKDGRDKNRRVEFKIIP